MQLAKRRERSYEYSESWKTSVSVGQSRSNATGVGATTLLGETALFGGFPDLGDCVSASARQGRTRSVSVRPQAVPEGLRRYPKGASLVEQVAT